MTKYGKKIDPQEYKIGSSNNKIPVCRENIKPYRNGSNRTEKINDNKQVKRILNLKQKREQEVAEIERVLNSIKNNRENHLIKK